MPYRDVYERFGSTTTLVSTGSSGGGEGVAGIPRRFGRRHARVLQHVRVPGGQRYGRIDRHLRALQFDHEPDLDRLLRVAMEPSTRTSAVLRQTSGHVFFETVEQLEAADTDTAGETSTRAFARIPVLSVTAGYPRGRWEHRRFTSTLLPAYKECASPNVSHAMPFADTACNPPGLVSDHLTVRHAKREREAGEIERLRAGHCASPGRPGGAEDADASLKVSITDVRNQSGLSDYTGELRQSSACASPTRPMAPAKRRRGPRSTCRST